MPEIVNMPEVLDTVIAERAKYGTPLGEQNAWNICNATAYTHRQAGWGLLAKTTGANVNGYSMDVIINPRTREAVDILGSAETEGRPQWLPIAWGVDFAARFVAPTRPGGPEPPPPPPPPPAPDLEARVARIERVLTYHHLEGAGDA